MVYNEVKAINEANVLHLEGLKAFAGEYDVKNIYL